MPISIYPFTRICKKCNAEFIVSERKFKNRTHVPENARIQEYRQQRLTTPEVKPFWLDQKLKKFLRKNIANNALANLKHLEILIIVLLNVEI